MKTSKTTKKPPLEIKSNLALFFKANWKFLLLMSLITLLATLIRFYNFENRINFGPEQGLSLTVSGDYINEKFSLLGLPNLQRSTSTGLTIFSGSLFNYSLIPLLVIFNYNPVPITAFFAVLNILTGLAVAWLGWRLFNPKVATFSLFLFLFESNMIYHSSFIWILNYLPLLGVGLVYLVHQLWQQRNLSSKKSFPKQFLLVLGIGFLAGIGFNLQYLFLPTALLLLAGSIWLSEKKYLAILIFIFGFVLGNLPMLLFDLKHDWYHLNALGQYILDTLQKPGQNKISLYHFFQWWPLLALGGAWLLDKLWRENRGLAIIIFGGFLFISLTRSTINFSQSPGMVDGLVYSDLAKAAALVANVQPTNFNITSTLPLTSSRAYALRYLLTYRHNQKPESVENYHQIDVLYVLARQTEDLFVVGPWEVRTFGPKEISMLGEVGRGYGVYKLVR